MVLKNYDGHVGIDIESIKPISPRLSSKILTSKEIITLGTHMSLNEDTLLRFSLKESIYKSIHPYLNRHVPFKEVEVYPNPDGTCKIVVGEGLKVNGEWMRWDDGGRSYWVTRCFCEG